MERPRDAYEAARARMVEEQLVRREITDERVIAAMRRVPRHLFVEEALGDRAYGDHPLPIGEEQTISQPYIVGLMTQLLERLGYENVWVRVGSGTLGWPDEAPFDGILVTAGGPSVPPPLFQQLGEGGRMVVPVGDAVNQTLTVVEKIRGEMKTRPCGECKFVKLVGKYAWEA